MKRRGQGEGSIYQRADGQWVASVSLGWRGGKRARKVFYGKTRKQAQERLLTALRALESCVEPSRRGDTVALFLQDWLGAIRGKVRATTHRRYSQIVTGQLVPHLGRYPLDKLTPAHVEAMLRQLADDGLSERTVHHVRAVLRAALARAMRHGLVSRNVAALAEPPRVKHREVASLDPEQVKTLLAAIKGHRHETLFTLAVASGMRQGELLGLRWSDLDLEGGTLTVRHSLQRGELVETKTSQSRRTIPLPRVALSALREHRLALMQQRLFSAYVFSDIDGKPLGGSGVYHAFQAVLRDAGLPRVTFHALRHTAASLLLAQGAHPRVVMELLGHSTIALTMNTYSHVIPALKRDAADRMDAVLGGGV